MSAAPTAPATPSVRMPCGPDCAYARVLPGSYGEWIWCEHPLVGGRLMREGIECGSFQSPAGSPRSDFRRN